MKKLGFDGNTLRKFNLVDIFQIISAKSVMLNNLLFQYNFCIKKSAPKFKIKNF